MKVYFSYGWEVKGNKQQYSPAFCAIFMLFPIMSIKGEFVCKLFTFGVFLRNVGEKRVFFGNFEDEIIGFARFLRKNAT